MRRLAFLVRQHDSVPCGNRRDCRSLPLYFNHIHPPILPNPTAILPLAGRGDFPYIYSDVLI